MPVEVHLQQQRCAPDKHVEDFCVLVGQVTWIEFIRVLTQLMTHDDEASVFLQRSTVDIMVRRSNSGTSFVGCWQQIFWLFRLSSLGQ
jgi:hypothetical protein